MHHNLLNAEVASVKYPSAGNKNMHVIRVIKALTKVQDKCSCCTYAFRQQLRGYFSNKTGILKSVKK
jgi:hypothetical protein